ncbi:unnamed protein product, partial [Cuscuta epithymum]
MLFLLPPEWPPWRNSTIRVFTTISITAKMIVFRFYFISIVCCLFILCCKTFTLGLRDERSADCGNCRCFDYSQVKTIELY